MMIMIEVFVVLQEKGDADGRPTDRSAVWKGMTHRGDNEAGGGRLEGGALSWAHYLLKMHAFRSCSLLLDSVWCLSGAVAGLEQFNIGPLS